MEKKRIRSAWPIYVAAALFLLGGLIKPLYTVGAFLLAAALCAAGYILSEKLFFKGREEEVETKARTGDREIDRQVQEGRAQLKQLREAKTGIPGIDEALERMYSSGMKVFETVVLKPEKAQQVRRFMNYYLPTSAKLMEHYRTLAAVGGRGEHVSKVMRDVENNMSMIADAFEKQLDNLYRAEAMDISSDIDVMETLIAGDGLTDAGIKKILKEDASNV